MSYDDLDDFILDTALPKALPLGPASVGFLALKKLAANGVQELPRQQFASPVEDVRLGLAQVIAYEFQKEASASIRYLLGQMKVLSPGGFEIPGPIEKTAGLRGGISMEQQSLLAMEKLCHLVGERAALIYPLRHFMKMGELRLNALVEQAKPKEKTAGERIRSRIMKVAKQSQIPIKSHTFDDDDRREEKTAAPKADAANQPAEQVVVPPPNSDSPEAYVAREKQLAHDQAVQELAHTKMQVNTLSQQIQQTQQTEIDTQDQLAQKDQQIEQSNMDAQTANEASQQHQQQAVEAEGRAAEHATQKMQLGMRVQQMRQALAEIATQDPVSETAANVNDLAAQGAPATPDQQAQEDEAVAMEEQAAAEEAEGGGKEQAKQKDEAASAQQEADQQAQQAQGGAAGAPAGPPAAAGAPPGAQPGAAAA